MSTITAQEFALIARSQLSAGVKATIAAHAATVAAIASLPHDEAARKKQAQSIYAEYVNARSGINEKANLAISILNHMGESVVSKLLADAPILFPNLQEAAMSVVQAITDHILQNLGRTEDDVKVRLGLKKAKAVKVESETDKAADELAKATLKLDLLKQVEQAKNAAQATDAKDEDRHALKVAEARYQAEFGTREAKDAAKAFLAEEAARVTLTASAQALVAEQVAAAEAKAEQAVSSQNRLAQELATVKAEALKNGAELVAKIAELEKRAESAERALAEMAARAEKAERDLATLQAVARQAAADAATMVKPAKRAARNAA